MSEVSLTEPGAGGIREKWDYLGQTVLKRFFKKMWESVDRRWIPSKSAAVPLDPSSNHASWKTFFTESLRSPIFTIFYNE